MSNSVYSHCLQHVKHTLALAKYFLVRIYQYLNGHELTVGHWLEKYIENKECWVIQIGSNDGKQGDPISGLTRIKYKWKLLLVEPVPYLYERLKKTYQGNDRVIFENLAINDGTEQMFYSVKEEAKNHLHNLPYWYDQLGSFDKGHILKHLDGILEPYIEETKLMGCRLYDLLQRHSIDKFEVLHIDVEGYDWRILSQLDLSKPKPRAILYEHKHLDRIEKRNSIAFLQKDYQLFQFGGDYLCILSEFLKNKNTKKLSKNRVKLVNDK